MMARPRGFEPRAFQVITLDALTGLSYGRFDERESRQQRFQCSPVGSRVDADCHGLAHVRAFRLHDQLMRNMGKRLMENTQRGLVRNVQRDSISAFRQLAGRRHASGVDEIGSLNADTEIGSDDAVVRQVRKVNERCSCPRSYSHIFSLSSA